jgi:hypothetical protein
MGVTALCSLVVSVHATEHSFAASNLTEGDGF